MGVRSAVMGKLSPLISKTVGFKIFYINYPKSKNGTIEKKCH